MRTITDLFVDEIPFGYTSDLVCPLDSERIEQAFMTLRNPSTRIQFKSTPVQSMIDARTGPLQLLAIARLHCHWCHALHLRPLLKD
ncbi:hypothetical protein CPB83DRAFT_902991, partial [Crepidotus variabilis]